MSTNIKTFLLEPTGLGELRDRNGKCIGKVIERELERHPEAVAWVPILRRADTGEEMTWGHAPAGATRYVYYGLHGIDDKGLVVKLPDGTDWNVDELNYTGRGRWNLKHGELVDA